MLLRKEFLILEFYSHCDIFFTIELKTQNIPLLQIFYLKNNTDRIATSVNDMQVENRRRQNLVRVNKEMQENVFQQVFQQNYVTD